MTTSSPLPAVSAARPRLRGLYPKELEALLAEAGFEAYRARQVFHWLHRKGARTLEEMKNLPAPLRVWLAENTDLGGIREVLTTRSSSDGSIKFLFSLDDGRKVESVLMPDPIRNYWTLCLSSQVGCAVDCKFCVTGANGFFRHLRPDEITDQVLYARRHLLEQRPDAIFRNLVYMGMGEPLLNPDAVIKSIRLLTDREGVDLSSRRITVSTSGIIPGMIQLAESQVGARLALSLNAPSQEEREAIMPITKKYLLKDVLDVCRKYQFAKHRRVTFEYVMLRGVNDTEDHARRLAALCRDIPCKMNLIPWNPNPLLPFGRPEKDSIDTFARILNEAHYTVSVRWSKALDVDGACGQLAGDQRQRPPRPGPAATPAPESFPTDLDFFAPVAADSAEDDDAPDA